MSTNLETLNPAPAVEDAIQRVFKTMLGLTVAPAADGTEADGSERVVGMIAVGSDRLTGTVFLQFSDVFAREMAAIMLGTEAAQIQGDSEINDVISELGNIVVGTIKTSLFDPIAPCAMSTPSVIRGTAFVVESLSDVRRDRFDFQCGDHRIVVELHLKSA